MELWFLAEQLLLFFSKLFYFFFLNPRSLFLEMAEIINPPTPFTHTLILHSPPPFYPLLPACLSCCILTKKVRDFSVFPCQTQAVWTLSWRQKRLYLQSDLTLNASTQTPTHTRAHRHTHTQSFNMVRDDAGTTAPLRCQFHSDHVAAGRASHQWSVSVDALSQTTSC